MQRGWLIRKVRLFADGNPMTLPVKVCQMEIRTGQPTCEQKKADKHQAI
jgi:hypothetical protein